MSERDDSELVERLYDDSSPAKPGAGTSESEGDLRVMLEILRDHDPLIAPPPALDAKILAAASAPRAAWRRWLFSPLGGLALAGSLAMVAVFVTIGTTSLSKAPTSDGLGPTSIEAAHKTDRALDTLAHKAPPTANKPREREALNELQAELKDLGAPSPHAGDGEAPKRMRALEKQLDVPAKKEPDDEGVMGRANVQTRGPAPKPEPPAAPEPTAAPPPPEPDAPKQAALAQRAKGDELRRLEPARPMGGVVAAPETELRLDADKATLSKEAAETASEEDEVALHGADPSPPKAAESARGAGGKAVADSKDERAEKRRQFAQGEDAEAMKRPADAPAASAPTPQPILEAKSGKKVVEPVEVRRKRLIAERARTAGTPRYSQVTLELAELELADRQLDRALAYAKELELAKEPQYRTAGADLIRRIEAARLAR